jgi:hypothetical protein
VEQLVARRAHNPKVVGSSPAPATKKSLKQVVLGFFVFLREEIHNLGDLEIMPKSQQSNQMSNHFFSTEKLLLCETVYFDLKNLTGKYISSHSFMKP